ncbi:hypothetical protein LTR70_007020 [Exophiala xenobiotica]|uniref:NAD-dependent epimerase/dehydratase domain-containing protein n=1 Tax=Lithohypha guttulata TaxID=1690604 RepID=A0ABR0K4S8_9EURO|nr:hypothetical protein LTR24_006863 [Lithohypha guttulata]KAK5314721.1 hypothetical protein LTR70_007020 [Exophiala xenobiotica]
MPLSNGSSSEASSTAPSTPCTEKSVLFNEHSPSIDDLQYILVTGGLGFIGSHTSLELLKAGYNVIIVDDLSNSFRSVFDRIVAAANLHFNKTGRECPILKLWDVNYQNEAAMRGLIQAHTSNWRSNIVGVIHFAAFKAVEESIRNPLKYYRNNISGLIDFLSLLGDFGIKNFIFSSSATVYGSLADRGLPLREEDCVHQSENFHGADGVERQAVQGCKGITNPYGRTKFFGEAILADVAASDPSWKITALRYFNPIGCDVSGLLGEDPRGTPSNLVPVVVEVMTGQRKELSVFGSDWNTPDGTAIRDFIHVTDLARGHIATLSNTLNTSPAGFRTYNLGTGSGFSVTEIVSTMESVAKVPISKKMVGRRAGDVGSCVAVADRAARELNWKTEKTLKDACTDICNFLALQA